MIDISRRKRLQELQQKIGAEFISEEILDQALTHSSYVNETKSKDHSDNERLELLGDAVLKLIVSDHLFREFPDKAEGDLTKIRAAVVSDVSLAEISRKLGIGQFLLLGKNEDVSGGARKKSNLANALEAIIAAIYLDKGLEPAKDVVISLLKPQIEKASAEDFIIDYKSALQELSQKNKWGLPYYSVLKEVGPKHKRTFWVEVKVKGRKFGIGSGFSKKEAEQNAAKRAIYKLKDSDFPKSGIKDILFGLLNRK